MATNRWIGQADAVAQVVSGAIASVDATPSLNTFTVTIGGVSISKVGTTNVATTAAALVSDLNASTHPYFAAITWSNPSGGTITGTADQAGVPFTATLTKSGAGTGTVTAFSTTTANSGPNDWGTAANWSLGTVPVSTNVVIIENSSSPILWGLDQNTVTLAELRIMQNMLGCIGLPNDRFAQSVSGTDASTTATKPEYRETYLKIGATLLNIGNDTGLRSSTGSPRIKIDLGSVQSAIIIYNSCSSSNDSGLQPIRIVGTNASNTLYVHAGTAGFATTTGSETATLLTVNQLGGTVTFGAGVTWTNVYKTGGTLYINSAGSSASLTNIGGATYIDAVSGTIPAVGCYGGTVTITGSITITQIDAFGGATYHKASTNITTINLDNGATIDLSGSDASRTVTNFNVRTPGGGTYVSDRNTTLSNGILYDNSGTLVNMTAVFTPV